MKLLLCFFLFNFTLGLVHADDYPASWWKEVPASEAYSWEILPQEAGEGEVILSKRTELGVFSNFTDVKVEIDGVAYRGLEGFWQMMKYPEGADDPRWKAGIKWEYTRKEVSKMSGFKAKKAGDLASENMKKLGINWVTYQGKKMVYRTQDKGDHYQLILRASWEKIKQNPEVKKLLLQTGNLILLPDHKVSENNPPAWSYYDIYMLIRSELVADSDEN